MPGTASLVLSQEVDHLDELAREPMLVEHPSGALFVAGFGSQLTGVDPTAPPRLWRSDDGGAHWQRIDVGTTEDGAAGNSDVDLAVAPDGTLYFASMGFDRSAGEGTHVAVGVSRDRGASWSWSFLSRDRFDDRPWVEVAPDGTAHVIWNDGAGVSHAVSRDGGRSWEERPKIHGRGGSSHLAIGPGGEIAVRITPLSASGNVWHDGVELIAVSVDGGVSWQKHSVPGERSWDPTFRDPALVPRWVEPLAWDAEGRLFQLWSEGTTLALARSSDGGGSWQRWTLASGDEPLYFPYLVGRGDGELAATWFSGFGESLRTHVARIEVPATADDELTVQRASPLEPQSWREGEEAVSPDPAGEYVPVAFLDDGGIGVVTPIQDPHRQRWGFTWWRFELPPSS